MSDCKYRFGPFCHLGYFNGRPSAQDCFGCEAYQGKSRGAGDLVAKSLKALRIDKVVKLWGKKAHKGCNCKKRQNALNEALPISLEPFRRSK